jgi:hypothetical protein
MDGLEVESQFSHPISHRTPQYGLGKGDIDLLMTTKKRRNFRMQRDRKIQDRIDRNGLGNRRGTLPDLMAVTPPAWPVNSREPFCPL